MEGDPAYWKGRSEKPSVDGHLSLLPKGVEGQKNPLAESIPVAGGVRGGGERVPSCFLVGQQGKEVQVPISFLGATKDLELEGEVEGQSLCQG